MTTTQANAGKRVLLIEDDALIRAATKMVLEWEGYQVACAENGQEALEMLRTTDVPAFILLDLMLPVLDGWTFRQHLQQDPVLADIPVVVVSAVDARDSPTAAAHVQKPFVPEELLTAIRAVSTQLAAGS